MSKLRYFFLVFLFALAGTSVNAGHETVVVSRCGKTGFSPITAVSSPAISMTIQDQWYSYMLAHPYSSSDAQSFANVFRVKTADVRVRLRYDDSRHYAPVQPWAIRVTYDITTYDSTGAADVHTGEKLLITYDPANGTTYTDISMKEYTDAHKAKLGIRNVEYWSDGNLANTPSATIPSDLKDVYLDLENDVERYYNLGTSAPTLYQYPGASQSNVTLGWNYILGAESYDVEWLFIDAGNTSSLTASPGFDFDWKNATRVNVPGNHYTIELAYPRGILLMRVRPVGIDYEHYIQTGYIVRSEGTWSYASETGNTYTNASLISSSNARLASDISGREASLNWQYSASYAEDGKKSEAIGFYDGALYNRQGVTRSNSDTNLVVAETRYDFEGRPSVQLMPTPVSIDASHPDVLKYQKDFNPNFDRTEFDIDAAVGNPPMLDTTTTTTGKFYSGSNTATDHGKAYTATTNGFAYTQIKYKNDGTSRPAAQSGVGADYKLGSNHEVKYYYGTPTGQVELDRLFGSEVGFVQHYQKNLVVDPNGQVSVSYLDQEGRVIATALSGDHPANLLQLDNTDESGTTLTADLLGNNEISGNKMISYSTITVSGTTNFDFTYTLGADTACGPSSCYSICSDCKYDLVITVFDEDNNVVTPLSGSNPITATNISSGTYTFTLQLPIGVYRVQKVLTLNADNITTLRANFVAAQGNEGTDCVTAVSPSTEPCALDCHAACEQLYKQQIGSTWHYYDANGDEITTNDLSGHTPAQQADALIAACQAQMCDQPAMPDPCSLKYQNMLLDMAPHGQYFDNTPDQWTTTTAGDMVPAANYYSTYLPTYSSGHINDWLNSNSTRSTAMLAAINAVWTGTAFTNWDEVRDNWDTAWARLIVEWHPEYCTWNYYCNHTCVIDPDKATPGDSYTAGEDGMHAYDQLFFYSTNGNYPNTSTTDSTYYELWNPTNIGYNNTQGALLGDNSSYMPFYSYAGGDAYFDPRMNCDFTVCSSSYKSAQTHLNGYLKNFLKVYDNTETPTGYYMSIWYVLSDPQSIHTGTPTSTGLSQHTIDFFVALHGDGTTSGILTTGGGDITPFQFFAGVYNYYRQLVIDQGFLASDAVADCQTDHAGSAYGYLASVDTLGGRTAEGYSVYFPRNPMLDILEQGCETPSFDSAFVHISAYLDTLASHFDTTATLDASYGQATCSCQNLQAFITEQGLSPTDYSGIAAALNDLLEPSALSSSGTYTTTEVQAWLATCSGSSYTMADLNADNFPPDLACAPESSEVSVSTVEELLQQECQQENTDLANTNAAMLYQTAVQSAADVYIQQYIASCLSKLANKETFTVDYSIKEYQYTLYYYDQAGTLVKTVPPEGVHILNLSANSDPSEDAMSDGQEILQYRIDQRDGTNTANVDFTPAVHGMLTNYKYNSLQHPVEQMAPDQADATVFYYDYLGRIVLSQNSRQRTSTIYSTDAWSYTLYDDLGRPYESGQVINGTALPADLATNPSAMTTWMGSATQKQQVVSTYYDEPLSGVPNHFPGSVQANTRGRVVSVTYEAIDDGNSATWDNASHYSYDIHGNVNVLLTEYKEQGTLAMIRKLTTYEYDLISGNVNAVHYQDGQYDEFHHRYEYDADNRVTVAFTSRDGVIWEKESKNFYYATGPLLRRETGDKIVQAEDYAYTAQGWIKGMNAGSIDSYRDIGKDAYAEYGSGTLSQNRDVALDAAGFVLGYYDGSSGVKEDYWSPAFAGQAVSERFAPRVTSSATQADYKSLFNGNIAYMVTALTDNSQALLDNQVTAYQYDQLNRIKQVRAHRNFSASGTYANTFNGSSGDDGKYHEDFAYDHNGNIMGVFRNGNHTGTTQLMDDFTYYYYDRSGGIVSSFGPMPLDGTNKLAYVDDGAASTNYTTDIDIQTSTTNYEYDGIGNLISDESEEIANIDWYANGKIKSITRTGTSTKSDLEFIYDAGGNRICKIVKPRSGSGVKSQLHWTYTYYVRDAQGQVLAVYERNFRSAGGGSYGDELKLAELDIYGSKRLGVLYADSTIERTFTDGSFTDADGNVFAPTYAGPGTLPGVCADHCEYSYHRTLGKKAYEVTNHLGNVLATVSDRKLAADAYSYTAWTTGNTKYAYDAVRNMYYQDAAGTYKRTTSSSDLKADYYTADVLSYSDYYAFGAQMDGRFGGTAYRYDFNGKETDPESDLQDYGMRIYNARLGKFLSVDPLTSKYPMYSPYGFAANQPIHDCDLDGLENPTDLNPTFTASASFSLSNRGVNFRGGATIGFSHSLGSFGQADFALSANIFNRGIGTHSGGGIWGRGGFNASASLALTGGEKHGGALSNRSAPMYLGPVLSPSSNSNNFGGSFTYGQSIIFSSGIGKFQQNGIIGFKIGDFSLYSHNDTRLLYGGGGTDMGYTGGIRMIYTLNDYQKIDFGTEVYTGIPSRYVRSQGGDGNYKPTLTLRYYPQGLDRDLNNGITFLNFTNGNNTYGLYSQGQGNLWLQYVIHTFITNNWLFAEEKTPKTEFGGMIGMVNQ